MLQDLPKNEYIWQGVLRQGKWENPYRNQSLQHNHKAGREAIEKGRGLSHLGACYTLQVQRSSIISEIQSPELDDHPLLQGTAELSLSS